MAVVGGLTPEQMEKTTDAFLAELRQLLLESDYWIAHLPEWETDLITGWAGYQLRIEGRRPLPPPPSTYDNTAPSLAFGSANLKRLVNALEEECVQPDHVAEPGV